MSSKEQYKGAVKNGKQVIAQLKKEIQGLKSENSTLKRRLNITEPVYERVITRKWWQFWKA